MNTYHIGSPSALKEQMVRGQHEESCSSGPFEHMGNEGVVLDATTPVPDKSRNHELRNSSSNRVYTFTYNESPMGKEHLTGKIKQTVVRSTRMYD